MLQRLTVLTRNDDASYAGTVLFNSKFMKEVQTIDAGTFFYYKGSDVDSVPDKYVVSDVLSTVDNMFAAASATFTTATVRDDPNDSTSSTTSRIIDLDDIVKGVALASDTSQSLLWISLGGKGSKKILVDKYLKAFSDLSSTGTTTTYA